LGSGEGLGASRREGACHSLAKRGKGHAREREVRGNGPYKGPLGSSSYISNRFHSCGLLIALMMEAARTSETLVNFYQITWRYIPEDSHLCTHRCENLKSNLVTETFTAFKALNWNRTGV
jgi:hypothetical protein